MACKLKGMYIDRPPAKLNDGGGTTFDADPEWQTMRAAAAGQHVRRGGRAAVLRATALPACSRQFDVLGVRCTCNCTMLRPTAPLVGPSPPRIANYWRASWIVPPATNPGRDRDPNHRSSTTGRGQDSWKRRRRTRPRCVCGWIAETRSTGSS